MMLHRLGSVACDPLSRLALCEIVARYAAGGRACDRMMVRVVAGNPSHQCPLDTALCFSRGRRKRKPCCEQHC